MRIERFLSVLLVFIMVLASFSSTKASTGSSTHPAIPFEVNLGSQLTDKEVNKEAGKGVINKEDDVINKDGSNQSLMSLKTNEQKIPDESDMRVFCYAINKLIGILTEDIYEFQNKAVLDSSSKSLFSGDLDTAAHQMDLSERAKYRVLARKFDCI